MSSSAASYQSAHKLEYLNTQLKADIKKSKDKNALLLKASKQIRVWAYSRQTLSAISSAHTPQ
jgi:hypothetical protein